MKVHGHFIDGQFTDPSDELIDSIDPATGRVWCRISSGGQTEADQAMNSACQAFERGDWGQLSAEERADCLDQLADYLESNWEGLVEPEIRDNGKRLSEVQAQFSALHTWFRPFTKQARQILSEPQSNNVPGVSSRTTWLPYGPIVAITPWNSPLMILAWKLAPALAAGNVVVVKPSEFASVSTLKFAELLTAAGLPNGVVNVVTGYGPSVGEALVRHPETRMVTFTGSDAGGAKVAAAAAENVIPTTLELGGKSPQIVFSDADLENAVRGILSGIFVSNGQSCVAGSRLIVDATIKDELVERLLSRVQKLKAGDPWDADTDVGPLANEAHLEKVRSSIATAVDDGAQCLVDGRALAMDRSGYFVGPTIFDGVTPDMRLWREEVFGPVLSISEFRGEDEAVRLANDTDYGLAAGVWTSDAEKGNRVAERIRAGTVYINHYRSVDPGSPIGGFRRSGYGRELGPEAVKHFMQSRSIWTGSAPMPEPFPTQCLEDQ